MTVEFVARRIDELPPLAWLAVLPIGSRKLALLHGGHVELFAHAFIEGAWDGAFADHGFDQAVNVFGSGGRLGEDAVTFVGPSHTLEPIYIAHSDQLSAVSNSLPFLLTQCGLKLNPYDFSYGAAFSAIVGGLDYTPQKIALSGGNLIILYHHNVTVTFDGTVTPEPKPLPPNFAGFEDYHSYLCNVTKRVFQNANDQARCLKYLPISTVSSGYDSATAAVVARTCGCRDSIGLATSNMGKPDSGRPIAESLGMRHTECDRMNRATGGEAEFLASGMQGEDLIYSIFEEKLRGCIVTTGFHGDKIWEKDNPPTASIKRGDISGSSLGEFRLRVGFLHLPLAFIGCQRHVDIYRISNSPEMAEFSVGGRYDRPIARRIIEGAGVARTSFAQAKRAASIFLFQFHRRMSHTARRSITAYCWRAKLYPKYAFVLGPKILWWTLGRNLYRVFRRFRKVSRIGKESALARSVATLGTVLFGIAAPVYGASHPRFTILLMWAVAEIGRRYAPAGTFPLAHPAHDGKPDDEPAISPLEGARISSRQSGTEAPVGLKEM